ncbi:MAG: riboflavin synthase [Chloroflexi bacterium]|nr:riboflavin synthase [Chloroflexota bacterium]
MFTGLVEEVGRVAAMAPPQMRIAATVVLEGTKLGDSILVNGACLTVTEKKASEFAVDVVPETLRRTNLGELGPGDPVNLERALAFGDRVGGHLVQGHVDEAGRITAIDPDGDALMVRFQAQATLMPYVVEKGFVAVDGVSLTVVECGADWFTVTLIPVTRANTVLGSKKVGDRVNLESDILAKYVRRQLQGLSPE